MTRFLAVYSTAGFCFKRTNVENHSKNSDKKSKNFFSPHHFKLPKSLRKTDGMHFLTLCTEPFKMSGATLFSFFYKGRKKIRTFFRVL